MSTITTFTGKHIDPLNPEVDLIDIRDIAHALSMTCRANGHVKRFYSVGQHCIACAKEAKMRGYDLHVQLAALLHDAREAYLCDIPRPMKDMIPGYQEAEDRLQDMIWNKYLDEPLTETERKNIQEIDDDMLACEFHMLMPEDYSGDYWKIVSQVPFRPVKTEGVEYEYRRYFSTMMEEYLEG